MLNEQTIEFELREHGTCTPKTGYFMTKHKNLQKSLRELLLSL